MKFKNSRWMIVVGVVMAFLVLGTIVWASPPVSPPSAPLQATPGFDADLLDGHDSAFSGAATNAQRANKFLWASPNGRLSIKSMPLSQLNNRYVFKAVANTIEAATGGTLLTVRNTGTGTALRAYSGTTGEGVIGAASAGSHIGVYGYNTANGDGVRGYSATGDGVHGIAGATSKSGVWGVHNGPAVGYGVSGRSQTGDGVHGLAFAAEKSGVWGVHNAGGYGVTGTSANGFGVYAIGAGDLLSVDTKGDLRLGGERGEIYAFGNWLNLLSNRHVDVMLDRNNNDANAEFRVFDSGYYPVHRFIENGDQYSSGTKSAVVQTESYGQRLEYAMESPEVWFEDFGSASLKGGAVTVAIEPIFAETVNLGEEYHVFLTPLGDCNGLYVAAKTPTSFEVGELGGGTSSIAFDYRIVAKRLGYENVRLEAVTMSASPDGE